ncbi:FAD-binding protein, partial [archaeon]|nr:FAD-binding protein [archaeon]
MGSDFSTEAIVIGAGPAGLGSALGLRHEGINTIVLERHERLGSVRKGETIRFDSEMDSLLGKGFIDKQTHRLIFHRTYYSHTGEKSVYRTISNPNHIISWPDFIQAMSDRIITAGARIWTSSCVTGFLVKDRKVMGVRAMINGHVEEELKSKVVFSCGGIDDPASLILGFDRAKVDYPVVKRLVKGYQGPGDRLEYHFHVSGSTLAVGAIFPRKEDEAEIILMSLPRNGVAARISFEDFTGQHPLFSEHIRGATPFYSLNTSVAMGSMIFPFCPRGGLIMAG